MVVMMIVLVQPHSTFFSRKWKTFCFLLSWEPLCRLFKFKSPTTLYQGNKQLRNIFDVFFLLFHCQWTIGHILWHNLSSLKEDSIAVSLFGNMTVETGEILFISKECIRTKDPNIHSDTETGTLSNWKRQIFFLFLFFRWSVITNVLKQPSNGGDKHWLSIMLTVLIGLFVVLLLDHCAVFFCLIIFFC